MTEKIFVLAGLSIVCTVICILLKQYKPELAMLVSVMCGVVICGFLISYLTPVFDTIKRLLTLANVNGEYIKAMIKALGVCYVTQLASDSCADAGQTAIASKVELCGKVFIVLISLPIFENIVAIAVELMKGT